MGVSGVTGGPVVAVRQPAAAAQQSAGLSKEDQMAVVAARPAVRHNAAVVADNLVTPSDSADGKGSVDTYL